MMIAAAPNRRRASPRRLRWCGSWLQLRAIPPFGGLPRRTGSDHRILVVDDSSPDGTGDLAESVAAELETIEVMHRPIKSGLGHAYLAGFARALAGGAELVFEMDSDFSHDPRYLGELLE